MIATIHPRHRLAHGEDGLLGVVGRGEVGDGGLVLALRYHGPSATQHRVPAKYNRSQETLSAARSDPTLGVFGGFLLCR